MSEKVDRKKIIKGFFVNTTLLPVLNALNNVLLGKEHQVKLALTCLLAKGHLLIEDLPGMGKTTLSHALANVFSMEYQRIQFTSDMLPSDIIGSSIFQHRTETSAAGFVLHKGPVFTQLLLADEINRATPKTQSALLEAMEERQVSVDNQTLPLPDPFFVVAAQNPASQAGTYVLPESQLDRFLMRITLGYPSKEAEALLLKGENIKSDTLDQVLSLESFKECQQQVCDVVTSDALIAYIMRLVQATREHEQLNCGLSPRASLALLNAAKSWAYLEGRNHVIPDDVQSVFPHVANHRLSLDTAQPIVQGIINNVPVVV